MEWKRYLPPSPCVVYLSPEIFIDQSLWSTSGGLGIVGHSFLRASHQLGIPVIGSTIRWRYGSYSQTLGPDGMGYEFPEPRLAEGQIIDTGIRIPVKLHDNPQVSLRVSLIPPDKYGTVPCICLDADIEGNDEVSRRNTHRQYSEFPRGKLAQMIILGIGGVRAFRALGIPVAKWHLNEGFSVLATTELIREKKAAGLSLAEALQKTKAEVVFTTHMPGMPGSESYSRREMIEMGCFPGLEDSEISALGRNPCEPDQFHVTAASLRIAGKANAVSQLHAKTTQELYAWVEGKCQIIPITNGVDVSYWQLPEFAEAKTPEALKAAKRKYKGLLSGTISKTYSQYQTAKVFDSDTLRMGWGRRFDTYKRPWIAMSLGSNGFRMRTAMSGKPHLSDHGMIALWNEIWRKSKLLENLAILPEDGYGSKILMKAGVDLWLLSSRRPREACEDCFMSAMMNGALVMATHDGGPLEIGPDHRFLYGVEGPCHSIEEQDRLDSEAANQKLSQILKLHYEQSDVWWRMVLEAKEEAETKFSAEREVREYAEKLYA